MKITNLFIFLIIIIFFDFYAIISDFMIINTGMCRPENLTSGIDGVNCLAFTPVYSMIHLVVTIVILIKTKTNKLSLGTKLLMGFLLVLTINYLWFLIVMGLAGIPIVLLIISFVLYKIVRNRLY